VRPGDLIVAVNGSAVDGMDALYRHVSRWPAGTTLTLQLVRRTRSLAVEITPTEQ
jgi:S1-C subfamily serine protease